MNASEKGGARIIPSALTHSFMLASRIYLARVGIELTRYS